MGDYQSFDDMPSLAPLQITPQMMAQAQQQASEAPAPAPAPWAPPPQQHVVAPPMPADDGGDQLDSLAQMFPDYDRDVLASILATCGGGIEEAIQQLLEMSGGGGGGGGGEYDSDEAMAMALFKQFADDLVQQLGRPVPPEVRDDPVKYEAFIREQFERELGNSDSRLASQALAMYESQGPRGGGGGGKPADKEGFLERMRKNFESRRQHAVKVDGGAQPLLLADHDGSSSSAQDSVQHART